MVERGNIIDFESWSVPTSWNDITLKMYSDIGRYYDERGKEGGVDIREVLHILCNKTVDEVNELPIDFAEDILAMLMFMEEPIPEAKPSNKVEIDGETYEINIMEKMKTGEYVAVDTILKSDNKDYASVLAVLCRKRGEIYDSEFEAEKFEGRKEMFERQPITKIMPLLGFFLTRFLVFIQPSLLSSEILDSLSSIAESIKSSRANGELSALSYKLLMRKLKKLEKLTKSI